MLFAPQHTDVSRYVYSRPPLAVKASAATLLRAEHIFTSGIHKQGNVYLISGERILSMRPEYTGHMGGQVTYYRANVFSKVTGMCRFVDLTPKQMVKVVQG